MFEYVKTMTHLLFFLVNDYILFFKSKGTFTSALEGPIGADSVNKDGKNNTAKWRTQ